MVPPGAKEVGIDTRPRCLGLHIRLGRDARHCGRDGGLPGVRDGLHRGDGGLREGLSVFGRLMEPCRVVPALGICLPLISRVRSANCWICCLLSGRRTMTWSSRSS